MSLFSSLQMAGNTLQAMQIGLHVVGNNIANANTPGYVREKAVFSTAPVQKLGNLTLGLGVEITGIVQIIDEFTESRLRDAGGDRASAEAQENAYRSLEALLGDLNADTSVTSQVTEFFNALDDIAINTGTDTAGYRDLAIKAGQTLTQTINTLERSIEDNFSDQDTRVEQITDEINTLAEEIRTLNLSIVTIEGGGATGSDAGALRSQRGIALKSLSQLADVTITETETGVTNVNINGEILVFEATRREVFVEQDASTGRDAAKIKFTDNGSEFVVTGGELHGTYQARDSVYGGFLDGLDNFAQALIFEFNKAYSQGQGTSGFDNLTSTYRVDDPDAALDVAGLEFAPKNGKFELIINNKNSDDNATSHIINIDLNGFDTETSLSSLAAAISEVSGVSASVTLDNELEIVSDSSDIEFAFKNDTSGVLAALGLNTFFDGSSAGSLKVNQVLTTGEDPGSLFAASLDGIGDNVENTLALNRLRDEGLEGLDGSTILGVYSQLINETTQGATIASSIADGLRVFEGTLEAGAQAASGVNLDEEAIDMIQLQRAYQASARYIQTVSELLDILVNL